MRTITDAERRARLGIRHLLARPADDVLTVTERMLALHATDPATVSLSIRARFPDVEESDIAAALYRNRSLLRIHAMRTTLWVVPTDVAPMIESGVTAEVAEKNRGRLLRLMAPHVNGEIEAWYERAKSGVVRHLAEHGSAFGDELKEAVPELQLTFPASGGTFVASSRILFLIAADGDIVRTEPRGSWRSNVFEWRLRRDWIPEATSPDVDVARAELARRWLAAFGPGTLDDLSWWTGWGKRVTRAAMDAADAVVVRLEDGSEAFVARGDLDEIDSDEPWAALLPALDPTVMGWKNRAWYLGGHRDSLFDRNGNAGPTIWVDGAVVGGWAHRPDTGVAIELLEPVGARATARIREEAERLTTWLGDHVVVPRFRTPLERKLTG